MPRPAVFLDRDGTITREVDYLRTVAQLHLLPGAASTIRELNRAGLAVVLVTNQSGIARGMLTEQALQEIHAVMQRRLARGGAHLDGIYYCPHHPQADLPEYRRVCDCRKPAAGMLHRAARDLDLELARSYVVGDRARDLLPGQQVGCRTVLVRTGYGAREEATWAESWRPNAAVKGIRAAGEWVLKQEVRHLMGELSALAEASLSELTSDPCERP